ncbi:unnamed protein product, partial [marine sediment metagenome]
TYTLDNTNPATDALAQGEAASDVFTYTMEDSGGATSTTTLTLNVTGTNDAPRGSPTALLLNGTEDVAYLVTEADLLDGFSDVEGDTLNVANLSASDGSVTDNGDGTYTITPTENFNGIETLTYDVTDGNGGLLPGQTQSYTVVPVNDPPVLSGIGTSPLEYTENDPPTSITGALVDTAAGALFINEINPFVTPSLLPGEDANGDGTVDVSQDEFIEIVNFSNAPIDLSGYTITTSSGGFSAVRHTFDAGTVLDANQAIVVFGGGTPD